MKERHIGCLVVVDDQGVLVGVLSERDVTRRVVATSLDPKVVTVGDIMTTNVVRCEVNDPIEQAHHLMTEHHVRHLPICEDDKPRAMLSARDILVFQLSASKAMQEAAEEIGRFASDLAEVELGKLVETYGKSVPALLGGTCGLVRFPKCPWLPELSELSDECAHKCKHLEGFIKVADRGESGADQVRLAFCKHSDAMRVVIPLMLPEQVTGGAATRGHICACGVPLTLGQDLLFYKASLLKDVVNAHLVRAVTAHQAEIDPLTGVLARRALDRELQREFGRAQRYGRPFAVVVFDVDYFKQINDTWGHAEGDRVLRDLSTGLKQSVRAVDMIGRFGGDEFVAVMPETSLSAALDAMDRLKQRMEPVLRPDGQPVTLSHGVAAWTGEPGDCVAEIFQRADASLYEAKRHRPAPSGAISR